MIEITFPDNSIKQFKEGVTGLEIAKNISERLAKEVLSITVDNEVRDINRPINKSGKIYLNKWEDREGKHTFWHSSAHLMAEALADLYPNVKLGIGPAIEQGFYYDVDLGKGRKITDNDLPRIEQKMREIASLKNPYLRKKVTKKEAIDFFSEKKDEYKLELLEGLEDGDITFYSGGNFIDLCKGPHLQSPVAIKAIKLLSIAGAYWRGDEKRKQLTRIYGISFPKKKMLREYLEMLEEAKKRDHRKLGKELEFFTFSKKVGQGLPLWLPKGAELRERLESFLKNIQKNNNYQSVITPHIGQKELYLTSGHYEKYGDNSYRPIQTPVENEEFLLKPMNCPHHCEIYRTRPHSYKELPIRYTEFGTVYRYEQSGELHGLTRVRGFTQDDAHIFCRPDQLKEEFINVINITLYVYRVFKFEDFTVQVSLRDVNDKKKYIGSDENWEKAENAIVEACNEVNLNTTVEYGEAAFYGPKLDFMVKDTIGRKWQLGTIQVDYNLPERFKLEYIGKDSQKYRPIMIHRAPFGSLERFIALLLEHTGGNFPLWLIPDQAVILPISEKFNDYSKKVLQYFKKSYIRIKIDDRNEKIGKKIRDSELKKIPYLLIIGEKEVDSETVSVRKHSMGDQGRMNLDAFVALINKDVDNELK